MPPKAVDKKSRRARGKSMSLKTRKRLLATLIDGALEDLPKKHADAIGELLVARAIELVGGRFELEPNAPIMITHPMGDTALLLSAINHHMDETDEDSNAIVARLIDCLGSQAAHGARPN